MKPISIGIIKPCCAKPENLRLESQTVGFEVRRCRICGCRHRKVVFDPGRIGVERPPRSFLVPVIMAAFFALAPPAEAGWGRLTLTWQDNATTETATRIERKAEACAGTVVPFQEVASVGPNVVTYSDTAVTPGTTYAYRVRAEDPGGLSGYSNCAQGIPNADPSNLIVK